MFTEIHTALHKRYGLLVHRDYRVPKVREDSPILMPVLFIEYYARRQQPFPHCWSTDARTSNTPPSTTSMSPCTSVTARISSLLPFGAFCFLMIGPVDHDTS